MKSYARTSAHSTKKSAPCSRKVMIYKFLPDHLHSTADRIAEYLREDRGVTGIKAEDQIDSELQYRPSIHGLSPEKYIVAVEVQEGLNTASLDSVILDCVMRAIPIKLF